ncbi:hypothetical protein QAD02_009701 [Eretmocerus hayati]|uniref:Uncharacterized protein n=1 Tax=Eretmocerus hayati TaxID=131215 RepID=A0ACC2NAS7_9HYME|nr:hypothetical protein QAD02_009701 [Eretmocerus hayati]
MKESSQLHHKSRASSTKTLSPSSPISTKQRKISTFTQRAFIHRKAVDNVIGVKTYADIKPFHFETGLSTLYVLLLCTGKEKTRGTASSDSTKRKNDVLRNIDRLLNVANVVGL